MQVHRLHSSEASPNPLHTRALADASDLSESQRAAASIGGSTTAGSKVAALAEQLHEIPESRDAVVARAREKVASGEYFTRASAEATAEVILRSV